MPAQQMRERTALPTVPIAPLSARQWAAAVLWDNLTPSAQRVVRDLAPELVANLDGLAHRRAGERARGAR
jgi:hypothetical protein